MSKVKTTLMLDEEVLRAVTLRAARTGRGDSEILDDALRRYLGLDVLEQVWSRSDMGPDEAMDLALEAQHAMRRHSP